MRPATARRSRDPRPDRGAGNRSGERRVMVAGLAGAAVFLVVAAAWLASGSGATIWAPLHLALAGGATLAIGAFLPYFAVSLSVARPAPPGWRLTALLLLAGGSATAVVGVTAGASAAGVAGAALFVAGIVATAATAFVPARASLGHRSRVVVTGYALALGEVGVGVSLAGLYLAGVPAVVAGWERLEPAHAWLNLVGFVTLTVAATLIHLYPTVVGSRIVSGVGARLVVGGLGAGPALVALGYALARDDVARLGAILATLGAASLVLVAASSARPRGRWTTDQDWHRLVIGHLSAGTIWLALGVAVAAGAVLIRGAEPSGWSAARLIGPLAVGCVIQVLIGSWTHLLPAIGPGNQARHAAQRQWLGRWPYARLAAANGAALLMGGGVLVGASWLVAAGAILSFGAGGVAVVLLAAAIGRR